MPTPAHRLSRELSIVDKKIAEKVLARANGYCEFCGFSGELILHHRKLRSQGGKDEVCNLVAIHNKCHNMGTKSIHNRPKDAQVKGFIVPSWADPRTYPIHIYGDKVVRLSEEGTYESLEG